MREQYISINDFIKKFYGKEKSKKQEKILKNSITKCDNKTIKKAAAQGHVYAKRRLEREFYKQNPSFESSEIKINSNIQNNETDNFLIENINVSTPNSSSKPKPGFWSKLLNKICSFFK